MPPKAIRSGASRDHVSENIVPPLNRAFELAAPGPWIDLGQG